VPTRSAATEPDAAVVAIDAGRALIELDIGDDRNGTPPRPPPRAPVIAPISASPRAAASFELDPDRHQPVAGVEPLQARGRHRRWWRHGWFGPDSRWRRRPRRQVRARLNTQLRPVQRSFRDHIWRSAESASSGSPAGGDVADDVAIGAGHTSEIVTQGRSRPETRSGCPGRFPVHC